MPYGTVSNTMIDKERIGDLERLALVCHSHEEYDSAIAYYNQIVQELDECTKDPALLDILIRNYHCLGILHRIQNKYLKAEDCYNQAIAFCSRRYGEKEFKTVELKNYLAGLYFAQTKFDEAIAILNFSLDVYKRKLGREHQVVALTHYALALVKRKAFGMAPVGEFDDSDFKRAETLLRSEISLLNMDDTRDLFMGLIHLSMQNYKQGRYLEAEELLRHGILLELNEFWPKHPLVADGFQLLGDLFKSAAKYAQAERLYQKALELRKEVLGENHLQVAASAFSLATIYEDLNRYEEAELLLAQCCSIRKRAGFPPLYAVSLKEYAKTLAHLKRNEEAEEFRKQAEEIMSNYGK